MTMTTTRTLIDRAGRLAGAEGMLRAFLSADVDRDGPDHEAHDATDAAFASEMIAAAAALLPTLGDPAATAYDVEAAKDLAVALDRLATGGSPSVAAVDLFFAEVDEHARGDIAELAYGRLRRLDPGLCRG